MAGPGKPGRVHKGDRVLAQSRAHRRIIERIDQEAAAAGVSRSDYIAVILARHLDMEELAPQLPVQSAQGVLPLGRTA